MLSGLLSLDLSWLPATLPVVQGVFDYLLRLAPVGAFIVALSVFRRQQGDKRKEQASKTSVLLLDVLKSKRQEDSAQLTVWLIKATNHSDLPLYRVVASLDAHWVDHERSASPYPPRKVFDRLEPGKSRQFELQTEGLSTDALLGLIFEDSLGRAWYRSSEGALVALKGKRRQSAEMDKHIRQWVNYRKTAPQYGGLPSRTRVWWSFRRRLDQWRRGDDTSSPQ